MAINNLLNMQQLLDPVGQQLQAGLRQQRGQISQDVANRNAQIQIDKDARKQKWGDMLYLLGGALKGNDMSKDIALLEQRRQLRTARDNAARLNAAIDSSNLNEAQKELAKMYPDAYAQHLFTGQKQPTSYQEYLLTDNTPTNPEYAEFLKTNKGKGTNITVNTADGTEGFTGGVSARYTQAREDEDAAFNTMGILDNMSSILDTGVNTGGGQETILSYKQFLQTLDPSLVNSEQLANAESFQSASLLYLTPKVKQLGTNPTDADLKLFMDALPTLGKSRLGNILIIDALKLSEQRKIDESVFISSWVRLNSELIKADPFMAELDLNDALREYRRSPEVRKPAEELNRRRRELIEKINKGDLNEGLDGEAPFATAE